MRLLEGILNEVFGAEVERMEAHCLRLKGSRGLFRFEELEKVEAFLRFARRFLNEASAKTPDLVLDHLCLILPCGMELLGEEEKASVQRLSGLLKSHSGVVLKGQAELLWHDVGRKLTDDGSDGVFALTERTEARKFESGEEVPRLGSRLIRILLSTAFVGLLLGSIWFYSPKALAWASNQEVRELSTRLEELSEDVLFTRLLGLSSYRDGEELETVIAYWATLALPALGLPENRTGQERLVILAKKFPVSTVLKRLMEFLEEIHSVRPIQEEQIREWPQKDWMALAQCLLHARKDPLAMLHVMADSEYSREDIFIRVLKATLLSPIEGREPYILASLQKMEDPGLALDKLREMACLKEMPAVRRKALGLLILSNDAGIQLLRSFLSIQLEENALTAEDLSLLASIGREHPAAGNLLSSLQEIRPRIQKSARAALLGPRLDFAIQSLGGG